MKLFIYCAGGLGREIYDICNRFNLAQSNYKQINFIDDSLSARGSFFVNGIPAYNIDSSRFKKISGTNDEFLIANGEPEIRKKLYMSLSLDNRKFATVICPSSIISPSAKLSRGVIISPQCSIQNQSRIGKNVFLNTQSVIGHDAKIGAHSVISSKVNVGGNVKIGLSSYIGMGSQIKEGVHIGSNVIIGMGSVVYNDIPDNMIALGNPARPMKKNLNKKVFKKV